jgi:hypothetical protein
LPTSPARPSDWQCGIQSASRTASQSTPCCSRTWAPRDPSDAPPASTHARSTPTTSSRPSTTTAHWLIVNVAKAIAPMRISSRRPHWYGPHVVSTERQWPPWDGGRSLRTSIYRSGRAE